MVISILPSSTPPFVSVSAIAVQSSFISPTGVVKPFLPVKETKASLCVTAEALLTLNVNAPTLPPVTFAIKVSESGVETKKSVLKSWLYPRDSVVSSINPSTTTDPSNVLRGTGLKVTLGTGGTVKGDIISVYDVGV